MRGNNCYCSVVESIGLKTLAEVFVHQCINPLSAELLVDGKLKCGLNVSPDLSINNYWTVAHIMNL